MTEMNQQSPPSASSIARLWERIPIVVRAIVVGFLVFAIVGSVAWTAIVILVPSPWSFAVTAIVLWIYVRYFNGSWWPKATSESRRVRFRAIKLPMGVWKWSLMAALVAVVVFQSSLVIAFRIIEFPASAWALGFDFNGVPTWQVWLFILTAALVLSASRLSQWYLLLPISIKPGQGGFSSYCSPLAPCGGFSLSFLAPSSPS